MVLSSPVRVLYGLQNFACLFALKLPEQLSDLAVAREWAIPAAAMSAIGPFASFHLPEAIRSFSARSGN